jgi:TonB family protein
VRARIISAVLLLALPASGSPSRVRLGLRVPTSESNWAEPNSRIWRSIQHRASFEAMQRNSQDSACEAEAPPEALTTPNPLSSSGQKLTLTVSFVVGTDGRVYSPLVLDGGNDDLDRQVLDLVRHWRYRPALCNGAPTEAEARVEFTTVNSD